MQDFKKISAFGICFKRKIILSAVFNIIHAIFNVLTMLSFLPVLSILFKTDNKIYTKPVYKDFEHTFEYFKDFFYYKITQYNEEKGTIATLGIVCLICISLFFLKNLFRFLSTYELGFVSNGMIYNIQKSIYKKIIQMPMGYFSEKRKGDILSRMTLDIQIVQDAFLCVLESLFRDPIVLMITLLLMFSMSLQLTLFVFIMLPCSGFLIAYLGKRLKSDSEKSQKESGYFLSFIEETLTGLRIIQGFNAENKMMIRFKKSIGRYKNLNIKIGKRQGAASPVSEFLGAVTIICVLWFGGNLVLSNHSSLDAPSFFTYVGLFYSVLAPVKAISNAMSKIQKSNASAKRILEILNAENKIKDLKNATEIKTFEKEIVFEKVSFKYDEAYILKNFSLKIPKGTRIAIVGESGSGKSTILNLLPRFYEVTEGKILIDGKDIREFTIKSLRALMGIVSQDSILFNGTVRDNLCLSENKTLTQIKHASQIANSHDFIENLPEKYETNIGDGGNKLSGGQKQRLSIARSILKNPSIVILDEATSALDTNSEKLVQGALEKMTKNRTSIVVAHRLSTVQKADKIIVLEKGKVLEQGTHKELIAHKKYYYKLVQMQKI